MTKTYDTPTILIEVRSGCVVDVVTDCDTGVRVIIVDHDSEGVDEYAEPRLGVALDAWARGLGYLYRERV